MLFYVILMAFDLNMEAYNMIFNLKEMFQQQARQERYETTKLQDG